MEIIRENALFRVGALRNALSGTGTPLERDRLLFDLSRYHRIAGIAALLTQADISEFRSELTRSGEARRELLTLPYPPDLPPSRYRCASHTGPFFDAIIGSADGIAIEIARRSSGLWLENDEFEDDFRYARFVYAFFLAGCLPAPQVEDAMAGLRRSVGSEEPARLTVCESILRADQEAFDRGIDALLLERDIDVRDREKGIVSDPPWHYTDKHVFIEGMALTHLAERRGIAISRRCAAIPDVARRRRDG